MTASRSKSSLPSIGRSPLGVVSSVSGKRLPPPFPTRALHSVPPDDNARPDTIRDELPEAPEPVWRVARTGPMPVLPAMHDLTAIVRMLAGETSLHAAVVKLQREACRLLQLTDALCVWLDYAHGTATSVTGRVSSQIHDLVRDVASSGRRSMLGSAVIEPIGPPPSRSVILLRRPTGIAFQPSELAMIGTLASGIAPALDRLL